MSALQISIEEHRKFWADVAKKNDWYTEPFYVQVWVDADGDITDSVAHRAMTEDIVIEE